MGPVDRKFPSMEQVALIRQGLNAPLEEGETWNILSCDWFKRWKEYVNFDHDSELQGSYPGEIINSELVIEDDCSLPVNTPQQLRAECIEGLDYCTLPSKLYKSLKAIYGSDIDIERTVISVGKSDVHSGIPQIELNPVRVKVFVVKSEEDGADECLKYLPPTDVFHFSRQLPLTNAIHTILDGLALDPPPPYSTDTSRDPPISSSTAASTAFISPLIRFWAKTSTTAAGSSHQNVDDSISGYSSASMVAIPTVYTHDKTDFVGDYMYLRDLGSDKTSDYDDLVLENAVDMKKKTLDLVIEVGSSSGNLKSIKWPRDNQLFSWTRKIIQGDIIGASDSYGEWFEGVVREIKTTSPGHMLVHFKGWSKKFDEKISESEYTQRVAPVFTKTVNWRASLKKGSEVEYTKRIDDEGSKWLPAIVMDVDDSFDTITLKYRQADRRILQVSEIELDSEEICAKNTHVHDPDWTFHHLEPENSRPKYVSTTATVTATAVARPAYNYYHRSAMGHMPGTPDVSGTVGMSNLGNTCFMNSTLQCLSNTPGLTKLFLEDRHVDQVNYDNVLGHKGELANVYAKLIKDIWSDNYTVVRPDEFKRNIGEFAPQFSGYQQHDSSELMMFLLDGLHEDMNRVLKKPSVAKIESKGRDDDLISAESWRRYLLRNDSELVDLCFGQLKSHVTCVGCHYESVTFDEYSSLSLPLPLKTSQDLTFIVYPLPVGTRPVKISVTASVDASVHELSGLIAANPQFKKAVESRKHSELGKRKTAADSSYLLVDSDTLDTDKEMDIDGHQLKEIGSYSDIENLGDICIDNDSNEDSLVLVNNTSTGGTQTDKEVHYFHLCNMVTSYDNARIHKTYDAKGLGRDSSDLTLVAYEMPNDVPTEVHTYPRYVASPEKESPYSYFDLLIGNKKTTPARSTSYSMNPVYSGYTRDLGFKAAGYPIRIAYEKGVTTRAEINSRIFDAVKVAYDLPDAYSPSMLPYVLHITSTFANMSKGVVNLTDAKANDPFGLTSYDVLFCCWKPEVLAKEDDSSEDEGDAVSVSAVDIDTIPNVDPDIVQRWIDDGINSTSDGKEGHGNKPSSQMSIMNCFDKFIEREQMPPEETWYCPKCKQHLAPIKKFDIWSAPEILVIHLKRFQYSSRASFTFREKVNDLIDFPIEGLDLNNYVKSSQSANEQTPAIYDLYGVSEHSGTMGGGHYTAKCLNEASGKWYSFNDSHVSECSPLSAISSEAYVLFYKRRHGPLKWGGLIPSLSPLEN